MTLLGSIAKAPEPTCSHAPRSRLLHARQQIHETVRNSQVVASDKTSARVWGKTRWQWTFVAATAVAHLIAPIARKRSYRPSFLDEAEDGVAQSPLLSVFLKADLGTPLCHSEVTFE